MRLLILILITGLIGATCGPKVTETTPVNDNTIQLSGQVVYSDSLSIGAPEVWVVYGFPATDSTDATRLDSVKTDTLGAFLFSGAEKGDFFYELYREPRHYCYSGEGTFTALIHVTNLKWIYTHRPTCENVWPPDTTDTL